MENTIDDALSYFEYSDEPANFDDIYSLLEDAGYFNEEVIYYSRAIEFLAEHDPSLHRSLELAAEMGYEPQNLSSEILASLLASEVKRAEFLDLEVDINDFLWDFDYSEEDEDEE